MRPVTVTVGPLTAASANNICLSQSPTAAFTINGALAAAGVATLDNARRVLFTTAADESAKTFTLIGTNVSGGTQSETLTGPAIGTVASVLDYKTVTAITINSASAGAITVGTNGVAASQWVRFDDFAPSMISIQCSVTGTVNYTIQSTLQDPNSATNPVTPSSLVWVNTSDTAGVGATGTIQSNFQFAPTFARVLLNSGAGSVSAVFLQSNNGPV